jgi:PAS domain S-box-containing protein
MLKKGIKVMSWINRTWRSSAALPVAIFLLGLGLSVGASLWQRERGESQAQLNFQRNVDSIADQIGRELQLPINGLRGAAGIYAVNRRLDRASFGAYVASHDLPRVFPYTRGFGFIRRLERSAVDAFVAAERAEGAAGFAIRQLQDKSQADLYVVEYIEPANANNLGDLGLDMGSDPVPRAAAEQAVLTGEPTLSSAITLLQDGRRTPGFLLYVPLYRDGTDPVTLAQRRAALVGLLYAPIDVAGWLQGTAQAQRHLVDFELIDPPDPAAPGVSSRATGTVVFDSAVHGPSQAAASASAANTATPGAPTAPHTAARYRVTRPVALPGRELTLQAHSTPQFEASVPTTAAWAQLALGALLSALLAAFVRQQQSGRQHAEARARGMTAELARLALVAQRTSNAVIITDPALRITWVNEGFTRIYGHSAEQALGQTPGALLGHPDSTPEALQSLREAAAAGSGCRVELVNRARDGQRVFIDTEVQPARDAQGMLIGFVQIASDITARKMAERELSLQQLALARIVEGTGAGTWEWDLETGETILNERWAEIVGQTLAELGATTITSWTARTHPDDTEPLRKVIESHLRGETPALECEARVRHKDGSGCRHAARSSRATPTATRVGWRAPTSTSASASEPRRYAQRWRPICRPRMNWSPRCWRPCPAA